jgi:RHS repeat-associated protein
LAAHYEYDANGNRLSVTHPGTGTVAGTYDAQDRLTTYGAVTYSYSANGDLQTATSGTETTTYSYDVFGNLTAVALPSGTNIEYVIDGQNRRIGKKVNGTLTQGFLYSGQLRPLAELDGTGTVVSRFVYGTKINVPEYMVKGGATYRLLTDHLGSVRLVIDTATGTIAQRLDYDEFGQITQDTAPGFQPFAFAGGLYDPDTKLTRFGARDYDAFTGRWTRKDSIGFAGRSPNFYGYAFSDPISFQDPEGRKVRRWGRPSRLPQPFNHIPHHWLQTDKYEAGMGEAARPDAIPGQDGRSPQEYPVQTETVDHRGQSKAPDAYEIPIPFPVDEECVNELIKPGRRTGMWLPPVWQCQNFVDDVLQRCRKNTETGDDPLKPLGPFAP